MVSRHVGNHREAMVSRKDILADTKANCTTVSHCILLHNVLCATEATRRKTPCGATVHEGYDILASDAT